MTLLPKLIISFCLIFLVGISVAMAKAPYVELCLRNPNPDRHCADIQRNAERWDDSIHSVANRVGVDPLLLKSLVAIESHFNANAHSRSGPTGLVQILPVTARKLGFSKEQLQSPESNLEAGAMYLKVQLNQFNDDYLAVVAYNLGGKTVTPNKRAQHHANFYADEVMSVYGYFKSQANGEAIGSFQ